VIAGDGEQRADLEAAARAAGVKADFLGFVNIDALPDFYAAADILVHAAEVEQYGMVILEAAVVGLPIIASDRIGAVGSGSIARPGVNTLVYACGDVAALRAAILDLVGDPDRRSRFARASLAVSEDHRGAASVAGLVAACRKAMG
jgi:glycosyltransferase involved in cell wall biosynthesis